MLCDSGFNIRVCFLHNFHSFLCLRYAKHGNVVLRHNDFVPFPYISASSALQDAYVYFAAFPISLPQSITNQIHSADASSVFVSHSDTTRGMRHAYVGTTMITSLPVCINELSCALILALRSTTVSFNASANRLAIYPAVSCA